MDSATNKSIELATKTFDGLVLVFVCFVSGIHHCCYWNSIYFG